MDGMLALILDYDSTHIVVLFEVDDVFAWVNVVAGDKSAIKLKEAGVDGIILLFSSGEWAELFSLKCVCRLFLNPLCFLFRV